jgi:hypothetical protein
MSESDLVTCSRVFATPPTGVYNLILVYNVILDFLGFVFHPWTAARPSVNADRLLTASMSWVVFFSPEGHIVFAKFETPVGHLRGSHCGAIIMVVRQI